MDRVKSGLEKSISSHLMLPSELQVIKQSLIFDYQIRAVLRRQHHNPPIWIENHWHDFQVTLHLRAQRNPSDMYGLDMVEMEQRLQEWGGRLPIIVNDCPLCPGGTTEELCCYFASIPLESHVTLIGVSVAENPERLTYLSIL